MAAISVRVDANSVCKDDFENVLRIVHSCFSGLPKFACDFPVFRRQTRLFINITVLACRIGSKNIHIYFPFLFYTVGRNIAVSTSV